jgi:hypothetical protein
MASNSRRNAEVEGMEYFNSVSVFLLQDRLKLETNIDRPIRECADGTC